MNADAQRLHIELHWDGRRVRRVRIASGRLLAASRLCAGRRADTVPALLGRLYTLCGQAHAAASRLALDPGARPDPGELVALDAENLREHLLYLFAQRPLHEGERPDPERLGAIARLTSRMIRASDRPTTEALAALIDETVLGCTATDFLAFDTSALRRWAARGGTEPARRLAQDLKRPAVAPPEVAPLRTEDLPGVARALDGPEADRFVARPALDGRCRHTGPLARDTRTLRELPPLARPLAARLRAVARLRQRLARPRAAAGERLRREAGLACAETSRGLLVHRARTSGDHVHDYRILAPTEWNFHPRGIAAGWLRRLESRDRETLHALGRRIVQAIDPCVAFDLELLRAEHPREAGHA